LTMRSQNLAVSSTLVKDGFTGVIDTGEEFFSSVSDVRTAKTSFTGVIDIGEKFLTCINDAGKH
jgi:hypothetical protein